MLLSAFYRMMGRADMSQKNGDLARARIQLIAASRIFKRVMEVSHE